MLSLSMRRIIEEYPLGFVASLTPLGEPDISPKEMFLVLDSKTLAFGDLGSFTIPNLLTNERLAVNFLDPFLRKGVRVRGHCQVMMSDQTEFEELWPLWRSRWGILADEMRVIVAIEIDEAEELISPIYRYEDLTEEEVAARYYQSYGVRPLSPSEA